METFSFSFVTERRGNTQRIFLQLEKKTITFQRYSNFIAFSKRIRVKSIKRTTCNQDLSCNKYNQAHSFAGLTLLQHLTQSVLH